MPEEKIMNKEKLREIKKLDLEYNKNQRIAGYDYTLQDAVFDIQDKINEIVDEINCIESQLERIGKRFEKENN